MKLTCVVLFSFFVRFISLSFFLSSLGCHTMSVSALLNAISCCFFPFTSSVERCSCFFKVALAFNEAELSALLSVSNEFSYESRSSWAPFTKFVQWQSSIGTYVGTARWLKCIARGINENGDVVSRRDPDIWRLWSEKENEDRGRAFILELISRLRSLADFCF